MLFPEISAAARKMGSLVRYAADGSAKRRARPRMVATVRTVSVRYVRPEAEDEERLRATCAELQALGILRLAEGQDAHAEAQDGRPEGLLDAPRNAARKALTSVRPGALMCGKEPEGGDA
jgi:hypothetical protein